MYEKPPSALMVPFWATMYKLQLSLNSKIRNMPIINYNHKSVSFKSVP